MGIAAFIIGLCSLLIGWLGFGILGIILGIVAIILGILGRSRLLEEGRSAGIAVGGIVTGSLGLLSGIVTFVVCMTVCSGCSSVDPNEVSQGQDWAEQSADLLKQMNNAQQQPIATPQVPAIPQTPGTIPTTTAAALTVGTPVNASFNPGLPTDTEGKPYVDYNLTITNPGNYTLNVVSSNGTAYDPLVKLIQNGVVIAEDDDSGGNLNAQVSRTLSPGTYTVRVTSFAAQQVTAPVAYTLSVTNG